MSADRLDELAQRLFEAARAERPDAPLLAHLRASAQSIEQDRAEQPASGARPVAPLAGRRRSGARWLLAAIVLGGGVWIGQGSWWRERAVLISAEARPEVRDTPAPASAALDLPSAPPAVAPPPSTAAPAADPGAAASRGERRASTAPLRAGPEAASPPTAPSSVPEASSALPLSAQLELLKRAHSLLRAGDASAALEQLERYAQQPQGAELQDEAALLRMEALWSLGQKPAASDLAQRFVLEHPDSPLAERARRFRTDAPVPTGASSP